MKFGVAIIFYNPDEMALKRINEYSKNFDEVLILDNSEISGGYETLYKSLANCIYIKLLGNEGMAKALNRAFKEAQNRRYDFLLTMDQDSDFSSTEIIKMKNYIENNNEKDVAIYSSNYTKKYWDKSKNKFVETKPSIKKNEIRYVEFCMTSGSFIRVDLLDNIPPLEDLFIGYVDNLLCYKFLEKGYKLLRVGNVIFSQQVGGEVSSSFFNKFFHILNHKEVRYFYMVRNNLLIQNNFGINKKLINKLKISLIRIIINIFLGEKNKIKKIKSCIEGYKAYKNNEHGKIRDEIIMKIR